VKLVVPRRCAFLTLAFLLGAAAPPTLNVPIQSGILRGSVAGDAVSFLGVPYAAPPVGNLRWQPPQVPTPWTGTRDATAFANSCAQSRSGAFFGAPSYSEDCLYLNVFTTGNAIRNHEQRPVMFWIHGGGLFGGSSNDYNMSALVAAGVVVVSINYRVGVFGFFAHPALDKERHDIADYGLMDQQMALRWVQRNIAAFGGDPRNVTIFGESAGGESVGAHLVSPGSAGLFKRGIVESGAMALSAMLVPLTTAETMGRQFATAAGCTNQDVMCLRALTTEQIVKIQAPYNTQSAFIGNVPALPHTFQAAFTSGAFYHVPVMIGNNRDEWRWLIANIELATGKPVTPETYPAAIGRFFGPALAPVALAHYPLAEYGSASEALAAAETDYFLICPSYKFDTWTAPYIPVYAFRFDDRSVPMYMAPVSFPYGAAHTSEMQFLFPGFHGGSGVVQSLSPPEQALSVQMIGYWTTFAKSGDPNHAGAPPWPKFNAAGAFMSLRTPAPTAISENEIVTQHHCAAWDTVSQY
jgi:para-nitrobenzyl esterase